MKFTLRRRYLLEAIQKVVHAISPRAAIIPILTGLKIDVYKSHILLTGSNSDITIQAKIDAVQEEEEIITNVEEGSIVLPVPHFPDIVRKLPGDYVDLEVTDNYQTVIRSENAEFTLNGQSSSEYPHINTEQSDTALNIQSKELKTLIRQTVFAVSTMETRPILTGVHVSVKDGNLQFTATDTHRLAQKYIPVTNEDFDGLNIVIPGKSLDELNKVMSEDDTELSIHLMDNQILFYSDNLLFISRLLNGTYPDTERLIPKTKETVLRIKRQKFIQTIERAAILASAEQNHVVHFKIEEGANVEISSQSQEIGEVNEHLPVIENEGKPVDISFSSRYLLETLKSIDTEDVLITFTGPMHPFIINPPEEKNLLHLILPVRTY